MMMIMAARRLFQSRGGRLDTTSTSEDTRGDGSAQVAEQLPRPLPFRGWLQRRRNEGTVWLWSWRLEKMLGHPPGVGVGDTRVEGLRGLARVVDVAAVGAPPCMRLHTVAHQESPGVDRDGVGCSAPRTDEIMMPMPALPLLIAGLIAMVILIVVALVVLVYSLLKKDPGGLQLPDVGRHHPTGHVSSSANAVETTTTTRGISPTHVCSKKMKANEEKHSGKVMVIMAGDQSPSFIAQPLECTSHVKSRSATYRIGRLVLGKMKKSAAKA